LLIYQGFIHHHILEKYEFQQIFDAIFSSKLFVIVSEKVV
ncbi:hypothetical protein IGI39_004792, partial [Enterococcus sp. AZ135]